MASIKPAAVSSTALPPTITTPSPSAAKPASTLGASTDSTLAVPPGPLLFGSTASATTRVPTVPSNFFATPPSGTNAQANGAAANPSTLKPAAAATTAAASNLASSVTPRAQNHETGVVIKDKPKSKTSDKTSSLPLSLVHPIFGELQGDVKDLVPSSRDDAVADELSALISPSIIKANTIANVVETLMKLFKKHYGITLVPPTCWSNLARAKVGSHVYLTLCSSALACSAPLTDSIQAYFNDVSKISTDLSTLPALPCLHVVLSGPFLSFAGSIIVNGCHKFEILSQGFSLIYPSHDDEMRESATRALAALANTANKLKRYYSQDMPSRPISHDRPYPTFYHRTGSGFLVTLDLGAPVYPGTDKLVYYGEEDGCEPVMVKFVKSYSQELHELCEDMDHAPPLRGMKTLPGKWIMVVTDRIESSFTAKDAVMSTSSSLALVSTRRGTSSPDDRQKLDTLYEDLAEFVEDAHNQDLVLGDILRADNIRYDSETCRWLLVDLEAGGQSGLTRYPRRTYTGAAGRPEGAVGGGLVNKEHDLKMLKRLERLVRE